MSAEGDSIFLTRTGSRVSIMSLWWDIRSLLCLAKDSAMRYRPRRNSSKTYWLCFGPLSELSIICDSV